MSRYSHSRNLELALLSITRDGIRMYSCTFLQSLPSRFARRVAYAYAYAYALRKHDQLWAMSRCRWLARRETGL